jgi:glycosyltransferase involved in cell wall biosynthesis
MASCLYVDSRLSTIGVFDEAWLATFTERHHFRAPAVEFQTVGSVRDEITNRPAEAVVFELAAGLPSRRHLALVRHALRSGRMVFLYWPAEQAVERVDRERLASLWRHWIAYRTGAGVIDLVVRARGFRASLPFRRRLADFRSRIAPVPFTLDGVPTPRARIPGTGVYLRTDYWQERTSGGSYGHTCYVAKELAAVTEDFLCLLGSRFPLLDAMGVAQEVIRPSLRAMRFDMRADAQLYERLRARLAGLEPSYIYERICIGNFVGARLSRDLGVPYIAEYNGSEIALRRSFGSGRFRYESLLTAAEEMAFRQATVITVVSDHIRDDVVRRGIDPGKVLVNPNSVDCDEYAPATPAQRREVRAELGLGDDARVAAFIGTYGGWHGIDVLAAALPAICRAAPETVFLLIGDGNLKALIVNAIRQHRLQERVVDLGQTEQHAAARYLKAADIYLSPHSKHMHDGPFFGSPTKLFEYMALAGGIVASDLEQIGAVLSPALRPQDFAKGLPRVGQERAVLCRPGSVDDFVAGVVGLVRHPQIAAALGRNARAAAQDHYSWKRHVAKLWKHVDARKAADVSRSPLATAARG